MAVSRHRLCAAALLLASAILPTRSIAGASDIPVRRARVSPVATTLLDYALPGAGHVYAGEGRTGAIIALGAVGIPLAGIGIGLKMNDRSSSGTSGVPTMLASFAVGLGFWYWGVWDAPNAAHRANVRNGWTSGPARIQPALVALGSRERPIPAFGLRRSF